MRSLLPVLGLPIMLLSSPSIAPADTKVVICLEATAFAGLWKSTAGQIHFYKTGRNDVTGKWNFRGMDMREGHVTASFAGCEMTKGQFTGRNDKGDPITGTANLRFPNSNEIAIQVDFTQTYPTSRKINWAGWPSK
jgi:hypothetical protein